MSDAGRLSRLIGDLRVALISGALPVLPGAGWGESTAYGMAGGPVRGVQAVDGAVGVGGAAVWCRARRRVMMVIMAHLDYRGVVLG